MNFFFQRNPRHLVEQAGMLGVYGPEEEKIFLSRVEAMDAALLRPLVLVVGGSWIRVLANSYAVSEQYPADLAARHDVWFREYYEARFMRNLVHFYAKRGKPVAIIGHSWGGDAAVNAVSRKVPDAIELLVTLDPVSRKGPPRPPTLQCPTLAEYLYRLCVHHMAGRSESRRPYRWPVGICAHG